ncbi:MAG: DUF3048 domain-containing protein [Deinococcales bacterium]
MMVVERYSQLKPYQEDGRTRRRALLLSLFLHLLMFLLLILLYTLPDFQKPESYIVVDIGVPSLGDTVLAVAADAPALPGEEVSLASTTVGLPQEASSSTSLGNPDSPANNTESNPELTGNQPINEAAVEAVAVETPPTETAVATPDSPTETPVSETVTESTPTTETVSENQNVPAVEALPLEENVVEPVAEETPAEDTPETIENITEETPEATLAETLTETASAELESPETVAEPVEVLNTEVPSEAAVIVPPSPASSADRETGSSLRGPQAVANILESLRPRPQPETTPEPVTETPIEEAIPEEAVTEEVITEEVITEEVVTEEPVPERNPETPQVNVSPIQPLPLLEEPPALLALAPLTNPDRNPASAADTSEAANIPNRGTPEALDPADNQGISALEGQGQNLSGVSLPQPAAPEGGNSDTNRQNQAVEGADIDNLGLAASPNGSRNPTGAPAPLEPFQIRLAKPLAVMIDNVGGYPQAGFREASTIFEMPVEGGQTRLMMVFDRETPSQVGPVRSVRDYFFSLSQGLSAVLVHDGGSPKALADIAASGATTFNSYYFGELFSRDSGRSAPYNLYSTGPDLRSAINRLGLEESRLLIGTIYRPTQDSPEAPGKNNRFSGIYTSGFRYVPELNRYHWQRNGSDAVDNNGVAVMVDAVVIAQADADVIDNEGRLRVDMSGGSAKLYLRGKEIEGRWAGQNGFMFIDSLNQVIDLKPFKTWVMILPPWASSQ